MATLIERLREKRKFPLPDIEYLRLRILANFETGHLAWRDCEMMSASWNARYAGKPALTFLNENGYFIGSLDGRPMRAHRAIFTIHHGYWPGEVDHINGIRTDNRICNLREVTRRENAMNRRMRSSNTSGVTGVHWLRKKSKWLASIRVNGQSLHLGSFVEFNDAVSARKAAEIKYEFHPNHGCGLTAILKELTDG